MDMVCLLFILCFFYFIISSLSLSKKEFFTCLLLLALFIIFLVYIISLDVPRDYSYHKIYSITDNSRTYQVYINDDVVKPIPLKSFVDDKKNCVRFATIKSRWCGYLYLLMKSEKIISVVPNIDKNNSDKSN